MVPPTNGLSFSLKELQHRTYIGGHVVCTSSEQLTMMVGIECDQPLDGNFQLLELLRRVIRGLTTSAVAEQEDARQDSLSIAR